MLKKTLLASVLVCVALTVMAACASARRAPIQPEVSLPPSTFAVIGVGTCTPISIPGPASTGTSSVMVPTFPPAALSPMTTPALLPTSNATLLVIENNGKPHFLEFHAWW